MTDAESAQRGAQTEQAMTVLDPAIATVREAIIAAMLATSPQQGDRVLALHAAAQNLDGIRQAIQTVINGGKLSAAVIETTPSRQA